MCSGKVLASAKVLLSLLHWGAMFPIGPGRAAHGIDSAAFQATQVSPRFRVGMFRVLELSEAISTISTYTCHGWPPNECLLLHVDALLQRAQRPL
jgi:hypothetical protein